MAVLPSGTGAGMMSNLTVARQPGRTWDINRTTGRIQGETDGRDAVQQAVDIILHVERFRWQIYQPYSGMQWDGLLGQDPGYVALELQRRIRGALLVDDRVTGISNFSYTMAGERMTVSFVVNTVYGEVPASLEVTLA